MSDRVVTNSTEGPFVGPAQAGRGLGGALFNLNGLVVIHSSTLASNVASSADGRDVYNLAYNGYKFPTTMVAEASVVANQSIFGSSDSVGTALFTNGVDALGATISGANNVVVSSDATGVSGAIDGSVVWSTADPMLALPMDNGGGTHTMALPPAAPSVSMPCLDLDGSPLVSDQRGVVRPAGSCDPGAYQRPAPCSDATECAGGTCTSGFCCACEGTWNLECAVCSAVLGSVADGLCVPADAGDACGDTNDCIVNTCDGAGTCVETGLEAAGTACGNATDDACTNPDSCDDAGTCLANHAVMGTACGDTGIDCLVDDACDGMGSCADNGFEMAGAACGDATDDECTDPDSCDGAGTCSDNHAIAGVACGDQGGRLPRQ